MRLLFQCMQELWEEEFIESCFEELFEEEEQFEEELEQYLESLSPEEVSSLVGQLDRMSTNGEGDVETAQLTKEVNAKY